MLKIIGGGFYSIAHDKIKSEILCRTKEKKSTFLLVPEQQALVAEGEMTAYLPEYAPLYFEVTNFTRLADTVFRKFGGIAGEYTDKAREALIMWKTLSELSPVLSMTNGRREINTGIVKKALSAYKEMRSVSIDAEMLGTASKDKRIAENGRLAGKLSDLSKIMTLYKKTLSEHFVETADDATALAEKLRLNPDFFGDAEFYIEGFTSFTEPQYKVLVELMRNSSLNVHLCLSGATEDSFEFSEIKKTRDRLVRLADKEGLQKKLVRYDAKAEDTPYLLADACSLLWRNFGKIDNKGLQDTEALRIFEASDAYEMCDFVASDIKRRIMSGASARDFAVIARDINKYVGIVDVALSDAGISSFVSKHKSVTSYEATKLIFAAMKASDTDFEREAVIAYAKCAFSGIDREACDIFEIYTETWQLSGKAIISSDTWNMNPLGYSSRYPKDAKTTLEGINSIREKITAPLIKFSENRREAKTVLEHARALFSFLEEITLEEKIKDRVAQLLELGETNTAEENERLWKIICDSLDVLASTLGNTEIDKDGFENLLRIVISEAVVGRIPSYRDEVTLGSADIIRLPEKKHIYLIGVNHNEFPRAPKENSYFTDKDKAALSGYGIDIEPELESSYTRELFSFSRAFATARESVTLLCSLRDEAFERSEKAGVIDRIVDMSDGRIAIRKISSIPDKERIFSPATALEALRHGREDIERALSDAGYDREIKTAKKRIDNLSLSLSPETVGTIYPEDLALTQSRIDQFVSCPFSYYLRYNLSLSEGERAEFDARNIGTFIHAILENFFFEVNTKEKLDSLSSEEKAELVERCAKKYISSLSSMDAVPKKRLDVQLDRLCRSAMPVVDGICDELRGSKFMPRYFELKIGNEDESTPSPAMFRSDDGGAVYVYGSIDRVDTYKHEGNVYVRVVDYKTGSKKFSPEDLEEGKNLQMFLYLKSIVDTKNEKFLEDIGVEGDGRLIPAGVIYVKTDIGDVTIPHLDSEEANLAVKANQQRCGMILDDAESISAMNVEFLPVRFNKDGSVNAATKKFLYSYDGWKSLGETLSDTICDICSRIKSGDISTTSKKKSDSPCTYCKFKVICRKKNGK